MEEVTKILGRNLCGAYLQGSFAVGDADVHSDVDWAKHLEGSYVSDQALRRIDAFMPDLLTWSGGLDNAWTQPYVVGSLCRMLHTLEIGRVTSKREALLSAKATLDVE